MSIKPMDFQVMIPRTIEVSKTSNDENQRNQAMLQQQVASSQQHAENSIRKVYSQTKSQNVKIMEKKKDKDNSSGEQRKREKNGNTQEKNLNGSIQTSTIDIKV